MKNERNGQAAVLTEDQLNELLEVMQPSHRALFSICYYTGCRVSEALQLKASDIRADRVVFRASTTKTKETREVKISSKLEEILENVDFPQSGYLFPGKTEGHLTRQAADAALRKACDYIGLIGVSTHSFRRTSITRLHDAGVPLKTIQKRTGHANLANLSLYIEVPQSAVDAAGDLL